MMGKGMELKFDTMLAPEETRTRTCDEPMPMERPGEHDPDSQPSMSSSSVPSVASRTSSKSSTTRSSRTESSNDPVDTCGTSEREPRVTIHETRRSPVYVTSRTDPINDRTDTCGTSEKEPRLSIHDARSLPVYVTPIIPVAQGYRELDPETRARYPCLAPGCTHTDGFSRQADLQRHMRIHTSDKPWLCGCCENTNSPKPYRTSRKDHLTQHLKKTHHAGARVECPDCASGPDGGTFFGGQACVSLHSRLHHEVAKGNKTALASLKSHVGGCYDCAALLSQSAWVINTGAPKRAISIAITTSAKRQRLPEASYLGQSVGVPPFPELYPADRQGSHTSSTYSSSPPGGLGFLHSFGSFRPPNQENLDRQAPEQYLPPPTFKQHLTLTTPTALGTFFHGQESIPNVPFATFLMIWRSLKRIEETVASVTESIQSSHAFISYNTSENAIKFTGPQAFIIEARRCAQNAVQAFHAHPRTWSLKSCLQRLDLAKSLPFRLQQKERHPPFDEHKVYPLSARDDRVLIEIWERDVLPALPSILDEAIGQDHSASFVREGRSEKASKPYVHIVSSCKCSQLMKDEIKRAIKSLFIASRQRVSVKFFRDSLQLLYNPSEDWGPLQDPEASPPPSASDQEEEQDFPWYKQYWHRPGLGASVGLLSTRQVSATLGGYLMVDGQLCALTVDHIIDESQIQADRATTSGLDGSTLTSPSLYDVYEIRNDLDQHDRELRLRISKQAQTVHYEQTMSDWEATISAPGELSDLERGTECLHQLYAEVDKQDWDFELGKLICRRRSETRKSLGSQFVQGSRGTARAAEATVRMDWAIFSVKAGRTGMNRTRYKYDEANRILDAAAGAPMGAGELTMSTCDIEPSVSVHYVGRTSGRRSGRISPTRIHIDLKGVKTNEWYICCADGETLDAKSCTGDSGAWIIRDGDSKVTAQLWARYQGKLLISPINDIIADIKEVLNTSQVSLPQYYQPGQATSLLAVPDDFQYIHEVCKTPKKPKRYRMSSLPPTAGAKLMIEDKALPSIRPTVKEILNMEMPPHRSAKAGPREAQRLEGPTCSAPPASPVPSLVSASSTSPLHVPKDLQGFKTTDSPPGPGPISSPRVQVMDPESAWSASPRIGLLSPTEQDVCTDRKNHVKVDKASLEFILDAKPGREQNHRVSGSNIRLTDANKRSATFPMYQAFAKPLRSLSWDVKEQPITKHVLPRIVVKV